MNKILVGDCLIKLKELEDNSVDSIVTDPPYELGFMGKSWDNTGIANNKDMWAECLRVLKPGGHLLAFSGTRTYHRMASAIEDAGFEVRDMIEWVYGSGFPKSLNIGKAVDKLQGNEREVVGRGEAGYQVSISKTRKEQGYRPNETNATKVFDLTKGTSEWEGWGTALKPAHEPICMARKPLDSSSICENCEGRGDVNIGTKECWVCNGTGKIKSKKLSVAENCLKYGTGGINIDESRVDVADSEKESFAKEWDRFQSGSQEGTVGYVKQDGEYDLNQNRPQGRFPANLIHDNSEEVRECFPETKAGNYKGEGSKSGGIWSESTGKPAGMEYGDSGNASRFFRAIPNDVVDYNDFLIYNRSILTNIKQLCGQHLTKKKTDIILGGVIQEAERFIQDAELLIFGNSKMEKFLTDTASTIKTLIAQMTELKTLNVLPNWPIMKFTEDYEKTIKLLKELNTEDVKNAESINHLIAFKREMLELIRDIARNVVIENYENGKLQTENESMLMPENTNENIKKNIGERKNFKSIIYQAKASKSERNKGCEELPIKSAGGLQGRADGSLGGEPVTAHNNHPTVKPIALMEYLIKMVTPKGGIVLDPFCGSGSTLVAAKQNGYQYIGIEMTEEYIPIIEARLNVIITVDENKTRPKRSTILNNGKRKR